MKSRETGITTEQVGRVQQQAGRIDELTYDYEEPPKRINVQFSPGAYAALKALAREEGKTLSETIRDALKLARFVYELKRDKGKLLVQQQDGKVRELIHL